MLNGWSKSGVSQKGLNIQAAKVSVLDRNEWRSAVYVEVCDMPLVSLQLDV